MTALAIAKKIVAFAISIVEFRIAIVQRSFNQMAIADRDREKKIAIASSKQLPYYL